MIFPARAMWHAHCYGIARHAGGTPCRRVSQTSFNLEEMS
jgi:hypothetical protein